MLLVSPPAFVHLIGSAPPVKVEFLLFGFDPQVATMPTREDKGDIRFRYAFIVPPAFETSPPYTCGSGTHLSEVRVTDQNGLVLSKTFELCPLQRFQTTAEIVQ